MQVFFSKDPPLDRARFAINLRVEERFAKEVFRWSVQEQKTAIRP